MKRWLSIFLVFVITLTVFSSLLITASGESLYIRKIVSIVYDDSGSMSNGGSVNWAYANYALQSFCGLLNSDDQLYITYMSEAERNPNLNPPRIDLDASKIQNSVDSIRQHVKYGNTPYNSIDVAFKKLQSIEDSNVNTQYWLVIITDGEFQSSGGSVSEAELNGKLNTYIRTQMPNGSTPQISYLAIGSNVTKPAKNESSGLFVYESTGSADIIKTMSQIADKISGRSRLSASDIVKKDAKTIEISSAVPLLNIAVLAQKTSAKITSVSSDNTQLSVAKSASIRNPVRSGWVTDNTLTGCTSLINNSDKNISAGTYQIEFDSEISLENVVIMFEPALEIRMSVKINGTEVDDFSKLSSTHENDKVEILCKLYEMGTNNEISPSLLPPDTVFKLSMTEGGKEVQACTTTEMELPVCELHNVKTVISASIHIKGFNPIILTTGEFEPKKAIKYSIDVDMPDNFSLTMPELRKNTQKIYFTIYADGIPVDAETIKSLPFSIETKMPGKIEYESDGKVSFLPMYQDPVTAIPTGNVEIIGSLTNIASKTVTIYIKPVEYSIKVIKGEDHSVLRTEFEKNTAGVQFEVFVDGERLDKEAVESANIKYSLNDRYADKIVLDTRVEDDGTITVIPTCDKWSWIATYYIPTGTMEITATTKGVSDTGKINVTKNITSELIWNWLVPLLILLLILGEIFKYRFKYSSKIHYNHGESAGSTITGPIAGWNTTGLFTPMAIIPFVPDVKFVNGARFYAKGFFWNTHVIRVKISQHPQFSGTLDGGLNELDSVRFNKNDINEFQEGEKNRDMIPGNVLVTSRDRNYRSCQIYLYSDN